ncbi:hypothetical protein VCHC59A1_0977 [Vibrio cholerae HC-59A1]|nr:hypothetical protein VCHC02A1_0927 [Vibrio cholerae HC-02A1]EKG63407.1 hypothetical protein VCHC55A1_0939 [Vibrio cholerae HC-55A1]EKL16057.1 hypothetical protein VCHC59A1_0977 [Vibrio cholerae HC-59A1]
MPVTYCGVHCRTGSLESFDSNRYVHALVHCRTGSLETIDNG